MADLTMCTSLVCKLRKSCVRHEESGTKPSHWQSWRNFTVVGTCMDYVKKELPE